MILPRPYYQDESATLYCGDALEVIPALSGALIDAIVCDPPYSSGGAFRGDRMGDTVKKYVQSGTLVYRPEFAGDNRDQRGYFAWCSLWLAAAAGRANTGAACAVFTDWRQMPTTTDAIQAGGWVWRGIGVWDKGEGVRPRANGLRSQAEFIVWGTRGPVRDTDPVYLPGVVRTGGVESSEREHIAEKPAELMRWLVQLAPVGGTILDPFAGSGTTLRAAKDLGRKAIGIEIEERYCEIAARRCAQETLFPAPAPIAEQAEMPTASSARPIYTGQSVPDAPTSPTEDR